MSFQNKPYIAPPLLYYRVYDAKNNMQTFTFWVTTSRARAEQIVKDIKKWGRVGVIKEQYHYNL